MLIVNLKKYDLYSYYQYKKNKKKYAKANLFPILKQMKKVE